MSADEHAGLTREQARARLQAEGANVLAQAPPTPKWQRFGEQFTSPLVLLLLLSAVVAFAVGEWVDATAITVIVAINAVVGYVQDQRAEQAVAALRKLTASRASVLRDGHVQVIDAAEVVRGDVLVIEAGDIVAADARLVDANRLTVNEAILTGESAPVKKRVGQCPADAPLAERFDRLFSGTSIATGTGRAVVDATGDHAEMGKIAGLLRETDSGPTNLQRQLSALGRVLAIGCLVGVAIVAAVGGVRGVSGVELLLTSVSLAVAVLPEGLPAVVTVALAVGVRRMSREGILVRRLAAVDSLGRATVICTDKTGTLTTGQMEVQRVWGKRADVLHAAAACCDAQLEGEGAGDPMELAILRAARDEGIERAAIEREAPRQRVDPFDAATRQMTVWREDGRRYVKGALEVLQPECEGDTAAADDAAAAMGDDALRVLAVARSARAGEPDGPLELVGLVGLADAPRAEAMEAIREARRAGVRVEMITGDHPRTAKAVARQIGLATDPADLERMVHARATASDKTAIVRRLRANGEIVAMTGDGVNDAPSIREADVGVAMGRAATEVTRDAAELILTTDDLRGLVTAIRQGRVIFGNVRKTLVYLLSGNASELVLMLVAVAAGLPLPLLPLQLLWINLVGEPLPGLMLAIDRPTDDHRDEPPAPPGEPILRGREWTEIAALAVVQALVAVAVFVWALPQGLDLARTLTFTSLVFGIVLRSLAARDDRELVPEGGLRGNLAMWAVVAFSILATFGLTLVPALRATFGLASLGVEGIAVAVVAGLVPTTVVEITKLVRRRKPRAH